MAVQCPNPLKPEVCHQINVALDQVYQNLALCEKCKKLGMDVEGWEAQNNMLKEFAEGVKREFFPHNS